MAAMGRRSVLLAAASAAAAVGLATGALAGPSEDYAAVRADWQRDRTITPCRFSEEQLRNARGIAETNPDDQYTELPEEIDREIARHRSGRCAGRPPDSVLQRSPLVGVRIIRVTHRGGAGRELVRIRNRGRRRVLLDGATIRNRRGARARFPRGVRLRRGASLTVRIGCAPGTTRPTVRGTTVYACRRRGLFVDGSDVARLVDRRGTVVSQRGFGRYRRLVAF